MIEILRGYKRTFITRDGRTIAIGDTDLLDLITELREVALSQLEDVEPTQDTMPLETALKHAIANTRIYRTNIEDKFPAAAATALRVEDALLKHLGSLPQPPPFRLAPEVDHLAAAKVYMDIEPADDADRVKYATSHAIIAIAETLNSMRISIEEYVGRN